MANREGAYMTRAEEQLKENAIKNQQGSSAAIFGSTTKADTVWNSNHNRGGSSVQDVLNKQNEGYQFP